MSDTQQCSDTSRLYEQDGVRACGRSETNGGSCPLHSYTEVCGRVNMVMLVVSILMDIPLPMD